MTNFDLAKKNYDRGLWTDAMLSRLVVNGKLTATEYETITGKAYGETVEAVPTAELDAAYREGVNEV